MAHEQRLLVEVEAEAALALQRQDDAGEGRHEGGAGGGHRIEVVLGREVGVQDPVDAGLRRRAGRGRAARVDGDLKMAAVGLSDHGRELVVGKGLKVAPVAVDHLDEVDAVLGLAPHFLDQRFHAVAQDRMDMARRTDPGRLAIAAGADRAQDTAGTEDARPLDQAGVDGLTHGDVGEPGAAGTEMLVTPARSTCWAFIAERRAPNSGLVLAFATLTPT